MASKTTAMLSDTIDLTSPPDSNDLSSDFATTTSPAQKVKAFNAGNVGSAIKNSIQHRQFKTLQKLTHKVIASVKSSAKVIKKKSKKKKQKSTNSQQKKKSKRSPCKQKEYTYTDSKLSYNTYSNGNASNNRAVNSNIRDSYRLGNADSSSCGKRILCETDTNTETTKQPSLCCLPRGASCAYWAHYTQSRQHLRRSRPLWMWQQVLSVQFRKLVVTTIQPYGPSISNKSSFEHQRTFAQIARQYLVKLCYLFRYNTC